VHKSEIRSNQKRVKHPLPSQNTSHTQTAPLTN
jgi:hypothetical protein